MKLSQSSLTQIEKAIEEAISKYHGCEETIVTDIHLQAHPESGELLLFDDDDNQLAAITIDEWTNYDGDDFYTDDRKLQKQADILDADTAHRYVACGHNGCYYWQGTGKTQPIEKPLRACSLTAKEYWSFLYVHTNAMMFRNVGLQGIDPYTSGVQIIDNMLTFQFLPYGGVYYLPDCMFHYRQIEGSTYHRRSVYQNYILNALMLYQQKAVCKGFFASGLVRFVFEYSQLFAARKDPQLTAQAQTYMENIHTYHAGRLRRIVNYTNENVFARLWCEVENPVWFFITKVCRHFIWKPKVRALLEEARQKQEQTA